MFGESPIQKLYFMNILKLFKFCSTKLSNLDEQTINI
jgi:hypothetical protein